MNEDFGLFVLIGISLLFFGVVSYRLGKYVERRDLTAALADSVEATYSEGFSDGIKRGSVCGN